MDNLELRQAIADISMEVRNFRKNRDGKSWNWSCLVCGDSKKNKRKARFGVSLKDGSAVCHCYNCGYAVPFTVYLKDFHPGLYERYCNDVFLSKKPELYNLDILFNGDVKDKVLANLFYIDKFPTAKLWLNHLEHKKISLKEENLRKLYSIHCRTHQGISDT